MKRIPGETDTRKTIQIILSVRKLHGKVTVEKNNKNGNSYMLRVRMNIHPPFHLLKTLQVHIYLSMYNRKFILFAGNELTLIKNPIHTMEWNTDTKGATTTRGSSE